MMLFKSNCSITNGDMAAAAKIIDRVTATTEDHQ
jgi:hypothetical protein